MAQKPLAIGTFIINDELTSANATIRSTLSGAVGFSRARAQLAARHGRWPLVSGLRRRGNRLTLLTAFMESVASDRYTQRRNLLEALNPELEDVSRLIAADTIAPRGLIDGFGPWDVTYDDTTVYVRSLLRNMQATLTGPLYFEDGPEDRQKAIGILNANVNLVINPSVETNATNYSVTANATGSRDSTESKHGSYSYKVVTDGVGAGEGGIYTQSGLTATNTYTFSAWVKAPLAATMELEVDDTTDTTTEAFTGTGEWQRVHVTHTMAAGETVATFTVQTVTSAQAITFYTDAIQIEASTFPAIYCDGDQHGSTWSGTAHASTSSRDNTQFDLDDYTDLISDISTLTFRFVLRVPLDANADWPSGNSVFMSAYGSISDGISIEFDRADDRFRVLLNGSTVLTSTLQTFSKGDWLEIIFTLDTDNNSYVLYIDSAVDDTDTTSKSASTPTQWNLGSDYDNTEHADWIFSEFDVWDRILTSTEVAAIFSAGTIAGRARWLEVLCEAAQPLVIGQAPTDKGIVSSLSIHDDVRWRSMDGDVWRFLMYGDNGTMSITVDSDDEVYPVIRVKPLDTKTGGFGYKLFQGIQWKADQGYTKYPTRIIDGWDTASLTPAKMQADGDDLRVFVDGSPIDRWLYDMDSANTDVWCNINFDPAREFTLAHDIGAGESVTTLTVNESTGGMRNSGILKINSEYFVYSWKNNSEKQFTGVTRAAHGSSAGAHSTDDDVLWIQHEIYIMYGDSSHTSSPTANPKYKPMFDLATSTNGTWTYTTFGDSDGKRLGRWTKQLISTIWSLPDDPEFYTDSDYANADPYDAIGIYAASYLAWGRWHLYNPCGISAANFTGGRKKYTSSGVWGSVIRSSTNGIDWTQEYEIPEPTATGVWENWSRNETLDAGSLYVALQIGENTIGSPPWVTDTYVDADACAITITAANVMGVTDGSEEANYELDVTIKNVTTDESIQLSFQMEEDKVLEVDSASKTLIYIDNGSRQMQALTLVESARRNWLRLLPGLNELTWSDVGTVQVELVIYCDRRYFE